MVARDRVRKNGARIATWASLALAAAAACVLPGPRASALRLPSEEPAPQVRVHVQWNQQYLCLAAKVPDAMLTGSSVGPMSAPEQDDAIEFCFETPTSSPSSRAHRLIISAAGGMTLLTRDQRGYWRTDSSWVSGPRTIKYAVDLDGTLNDPTDRDTGFVVECAIPWEFLQGPPIDRPEIGFNVVCWMQGENEGFVSWSPSADEAEHLGDTLRWGRMVISTTAALASAQGAWVPCPFVPHTPLVDGKLAASEWLAASTLHFDKPKLSVAAPAPGREGAGGLGLLMAVYRYDWRGDPAREGGASLWTTEGAPATADQPIEAAGPWYSYDRVAYHDGQLREIERAGVDIILPRYRGDEAARLTWARAGLDCLGEALKRRRADGRSHPLVGMLLDTDPLAGVDLRSEEGKRRIYAMVREFFLHVPPEFWAELPSRADDALAPTGVPILLGDPDGLADWDGAFPAYCEKRFAEDFGGAGLVWLGSSAWRARSADSFYAHVRLPEEVGFAQEAVGGAVAIALSPGYCPPAGTAGEVRPRRGGRAYRSDLQRALAAQPDLIIINSWNDFANATEIAPSRQYGVTYVDATRYFKARMASEAPLQLRLKKRAVPHVLQPGADYLAELVVENAGTQDLHTGARVTADCRIARRADGQVVQGKVAAQGLTILAGQTKRLPVLISTRDNDGRPLPPGDYLFSLLVVRTKVAYFRSRWFTSTLAELTFPITVGEPPARQATVLSTSLPCAIESGATQHVAVRLRNDGARTWRRGETRLTYRWLAEQHAPGGSVVLAALDEPYAGAAARAELPDDVAPGQVVSVPVAVVAPREAGASGGPGRLSQHGLRLQWDLVEGDGILYSEVGAPLVTEAVQVLPGHLGVAYESVTPPGQMEPSQEAVLGLRLRNTGGRTWRAGTASVRYRWHLWDGREHLAGPPVLLPEEVPPGSMAEVEVRLRAPAIAGSYWLTWDAVVGGETASECQNSPPVTPVSVRSRSVRALDLSPFANVAAVTSDAQRARGDFDGAGRTFPAECLPPDHSAAADGLYPSGYYASDSRQAVPFAFPATGSGVGGAVACNGQSIPLGEGEVARLHLLAASTAGARRANFGFRSGDAEPQYISALVPAWTERDDSVPVAAYAGYLRTLQKDDASAAGYLYHIALDCPRPGPHLLLLPQDTAVKILAITVETY